MLANANMSYYYFTICFGGTMLTTVCFANYHIEPGTKLRTLIDVPHTLNAIPTTFINGKYDGPTVLVTSGVHGSEYPGRVLCAYAELPEDYEPQVPHTHVHTHSLPEKVSE